MGLFKTLLYAVVIYYGIKFIRTMFTVKKHLNNNPPPNFGNDFNNQHRNDNDDDNDGEYVDYEEVD